MWNRNSFMLEEGPLAQTLFERTYNFFSCAALARKKVVANFVALPPLEEPAILVDPLYAIPD